MDEAKIKKQIKTFILKELIHEKDLEIDDDEPIITRGLITSFSLMEIGLFIEEEFGIYIPDADLTPEAMDTINLIVERILKG